MPLRASSMAFKSIMILSQFVRAYALHLQSPGPVSPGRTLNVTWTSSSGDPSQITLWLACNTNAKPLLWRIASSVDTADLSQSVKIPDSKSRPPFPPQHMTMCLLSAFANLHRLDSVSLTVVGQSSSSTPTTGQQESLSAGTESSTTDTQASESADTSPLANASSAFLSSSSSTKPTQTHQQTSPNPSTEVDPHPTAGASTETQQFPSMAALTTTSMTAIPTGNSTSLDSGTKKPIGTIVGGVLGGIFGLVVIAAIVFFFRRKRRNSPDPNLLWTMRDTNMSPSPSLKEEWWAKTAVDETTEQTEKARRDAGTTSHLPNYGYDNTGGWQNRNFSTSTGRNKEEEFELEQERRRKEIYGRMRRVLDNGLGGFDSNVIHN